jgi:MFS family permease
VLALVCVLTFLHYAGTQMRGPVLPLYAAAHGASPTGVGLIIGAHMAVAAVGSIPFGRASDRWGRQPVRVGGMVVSAVTSLLLPLVEGELALATIYGLAGLGVAAFSPSALSLVGDTAAPDRAGRAYAWYSTAHYGAIAIGPFLGGLAADWWGYRAAFVASAAAVALALGVGVVAPVRAAHGSARSGARFTDIRGNADVWAGWVASTSGLLIQGVVFTFFPLLAQARGFTPADIGLVFLVLGLANTTARFPAGWAVDRTGRCTPYAIAGLLTASVVTALLPYVEGLAALLALTALFGGVNGVAFVAISTALATSATPAARGLVMGGYSTSLYLGLGLGSFALGPVITHHGYGAGFVTGAGAGVLGAVLAAALWTRAGTLCGKAGTSTQQGRQHPERDRYGCGDPEQDPLPVPTHAPAVGEIVS